MMGRRSTSRPLDVTMLASGDTKHSTVKELVGFKAEYTEECETCELDPITTALTPCVGPEANTCKGLDSVGLSRLGNYLL